MFVYDTKPLIGCRRETVATSADAVNLRSQAAEKTLIATNILYHMLVVVLDFSMAVL